MAEALAVAVLLVGVNLDAVDLVADTVDLIVDVVVFAVGGVAGINFIFVSSESVVPFVSGCFLSHAAFCLS